MKKYDSYKDSGIEWIGEIPSHWEVKRFKHLFNEHSGNGFPHEMQGNEFGDFPFYKVSSLNGDGQFVEYSKNYVNKRDVEIMRWNIVPPNSILTAKIGESLRKNHRKIAKTHCVIDNNCVGFEAKSIHEKLGYYLLKNMDFDLFTNPGAIPSVSMDKLRNHKFPISPFKEEQVIIANYLDQKTAQIDDLIANKERLIQLLEEERTAIINQAVTKGLDPNVPMKDSGIEWLGEVPEHWEVKKIKFVAILKSGENITSESIKEEGEYPVYGGNGLRGYYSEFTNDGDYILIGRQGALCGNIKYARNRFWASEHAIVCYLEPHNNWLWFGKLLESMNLNQYNQSAAQPGLAVGVIKNLSIPYPKIEKQNEIVDFIIDYEKRTDVIIEKTRNEIELLKEYKTTLISEVVTGKVDVK